MPRKVDITTAMKQTYAVCPTGVTLYQTIELYYAGWDEPVRVCRGYDTIEATLELTAPRNPGEPVIFLPIGFGLKLPALRETELPYLEVSIFDASTLLVTPIDQAREDPDAQIDVIYRTFASNHLHEPGETYTPVLRMSNVHYDELSVSGRATYLDILNRRFPGREYGFDEFPGLAT